MGGKAKAELPLELAPAQLVGLELAAAPIGLDLGSNLGARLRDYATRFHVAARCRELLSTGI
jgi:hypothetical protein